MKALRTVWRLKLLRAPPKYFRREGPMRTYMTKHPGTYGEWEEVDLLNELERLAESLARARTQLVNLKKETVPCQAES